MLKYHFLPSALIFRFWLCRGFERTILGAYRWLSDNYEKGDGIFLFGVLQQYVPLLPHTEHCFRLLSWGISSPHTVSNDRQGMIYLALSGR